MINPASSGPAAFSVVIPLFNGEAHLAETLQSIRDQTLKPAEIIVADDGSSDAGPAIAARFAPLVRVLPPGPSKGVQAARNRGIAAAGSPWIAFCDHDDLWRPDYLESHARLIAAAPQLDFVFTNFRLLFPDGPAAISKFEQAPGGWWERVGRRVIPEGWLIDGEIAGATFRWHPIFVSGMIASKALLAKAGGFDPRLAGKRGEDGEFTLRCLYRARVGALPEPLFLYRRHETNFSRDSLRNLVDEVEILEFILAHHQDAQRWRDVIIDEIAVRRADAASAAFERKDHALARQLLRQVPARHRTLTLNLKAACLALPDPLGRPLNALLQSISERLR